MFFRSKLSASVIVRNSNCTLHRNPTAVHTPHALPLPELPCFGTICLGAVHLAGAQLFWQQVEFLNPGGTSKDRIAASMIREAEATGKLKLGGTVVEGTSGSTGICLASLCRAKGYRCVIVMPDDQVRNQYTWPMRSRDCILQAKLHVVSMQA